MLKPERLSSFIDVHKIGVVVAAMDKDSSLTCRQGTAGRQTGCGDRTDVVKGMIEDLDPCIASVEY